MSFNEGHILVFSVLKKGGTQGIGSSRKCGFSTCF